jgi:hypothetical protein
MIDGRWLGYGWQGCGNVELPDIVHLDVGVPTSNCTSPAYGIFGRNFTNGYAELDCNAFEATLAFGSE